MSMDTKKLAAAALAGLLTVGVLTASPAMAMGDKSGCKNKANAEEKAACKGEAEKASCDGKAATEEKAACDGKSSCETR